MRFLHFLMSFLILPEILSLLLVLLAYLYSYVLKVCCSLETLVRLFSLIDRFLSSTHQLEAVECLVVVGPQCIWFSILRALFEDQTIYWGLQLEKLTVPYQLFLLQGCGNPHPY